MSARTFRVSEHYDAPLARVFALLVDADVQQRKSIFLGARAARCERRADGRLVVTERRARLGREIESVIELRPDADGARVSWSQRQAALPVLVDGVIELVAAGERRCELVFRGEVRAELRVLGGVVVRGVARAIVAAKRREHGFYLAELARG
ncbi:MAG: SRPBCC family protein [Myxococcales bacterium]|nr:SRPBCC family protein [Myxococcales bacterium]